MRLVVLDHCMGIWKRRKTRSHNDADAVHPLYLAPVSPYYTRSEALARMPSHWVWYQHMQWYQEHVSAMALLCSSMTGRGHTANVYTDIYTNAVQRGYGWLALLKEKKKLKRKASQGMQLISFWLLGAIWCLNRRNINWLKPKTQKKEVLQK